MIIYIYDSTPEIYKALSWTSYTTKTMKNDSEDIIEDNIKNHSPYTSNGDKPSKGKSFLLIDLPKK